VLQIKLEENPSSLGASAQIINHSLSFQENEIYAKAIDEVTFSSPACRGIIRNNTEETKYLTLNLMVYFKFYKA